MSCSSSLVGLVALFVTVVVCVTSSADAADVRHQKKQDGCGAGLLVPDRGAATNGSEDANLTSSSDKMKSRDQPMCCQGKNNTCVAKGARLNAPAASVCFCDADCMTYGDCCLDYAEYCPVVDCVAEEEWGEWTECDAKCGQGLKRRQRKILIEARNGGRRCHANDTMQAAVCVGTTCKVQRASDRVHELEETGRIIPATFASWRNNKLYSPFQDIRKNLFDHYGDPSAVNRPAYCAQFELTDVHSTCRKMSKSSNAWLSKLVKGARLCVECQSFAMQKELGGRCRGHGVFQRQTQWKAVTVPGCHGKWRLVTEHTEQCDCDPVNGYSFSFV